MNLYDLPTDILQYLLTFATPSTYYILVTYFRPFRSNKKKVYIRGRLIKDAIKYDNPALCEYFISPCLNLCSLAAEAGSHQVLKWSILKGYPYDESLLENACIIGKLDIIIWLQELFKLERLDILHYKIAAQYGHLNVLEYGYQHNQLLQNSFICDMAARHGHLHILKWCREILWPFDRYIFIAAVEGGNLEIVQWLYYNNCPYDKYVYQIARKLTNSNIHIWLKTLNTPG